MLVGLRHPALGGGDDEHHRGHRSHSRRACWRRTVRGPARRRTRTAARRSSVHAKPRSIVSPRRCSSASRSGHMPVSRCTSVDLPWSTWPAVATTIHRLHRPRRTRLVVLGRDRAQVEQAAAVLQAADDRGRAGAQRRSVGLGQADRGAGQFDAGRPAAADAPRCSRTACAPGSRVGEPLGPARSSVDAGVERLRDRRRRADQRRLQRGERELVDAQRPGRGWRRSRSTSSASPNSRPACGPPSSLSPLAVTRSAPSRSTVVASGSSGSSGCGASSPEPMSATSGRAAASPARPTAHRRGEAGDVVVRRMHLEHEAGVGPDRVGVVAQSACGWSCRPRGAARPSTRAARGCRKPSPISTSSPRLTTISLPGRQRHGGQQQRGGVVVDHVHGLARRARPRPARPARRGRAGPGARWPGRTRRRWRRRRPPPRRPAAARQRSPAEVRVHDDAGRVDHRPQAGRARPAGRRRRRRRPRSGAISPRRGPLLCRATTAA